MYYVISQEMLYIYTHKAICVCGSALWVCVLICCVPTQQVCLTFERQTEDLLVLFCPLLPSLGELICQAEVRDVMYIGLPWLNPFMLKSSAGG